MDYRPISKQNIVIASILALLCLLLPMSPDARLAMLYGINGIACCWGMFSFKEEPYTLHKVCHIFILMFFVVANAIQYYSGAIATSLKVTFSTQDYILFQSTVLGIIAITNVVYIASRRFLDTKGKDLQPTAAKRSADNGARVKFSVLLAMSIFALVATIAYYWNDPRLMFIRHIDGVGERLNNYTRPLYLIFTTLVRALPFLAYLIARLEGFSRNKRIVLLAIMTITLFPTGLARNAVAIYWLPVIIVNVPQLKRPHLFVLGMLAALLVVFPLLNQFKHYKGEINFSLSTKHFTTLNYDTSQIFMADQQMDIVTNGKQLLGVALFFVPRAIWPSKPVGSGCYLAKPQGVWANISMPYWGEGYINFGYLGVIIFAILLATIMAYMDGRYWKREKHQLFTGNYLIILALTMFILRGDLLSSWSRQVAVCLLFSVIYKVLTYKKPFKQEYST